MSSVAGAGGGVVMYSINILTRRLFVEYCALVDVGLGVGLGLWVRVVIWRCEWWRGRGCFLGYVFSFLFSFVFLGLCSSGW